MAIGPALPRTRGIFTTLSGVRSGQVIDIRTQPGSGCRPRTCPEIPEPDIYTDPYIFIPGNNMDGLIGRWAKLNKEWA